ncbi:MAG: chromosome segregation protein SMC [Cyclobacteriaceae bacterium]
MSEVTPQPEETKKPNNRTAIIIALLSIIVIIQSIKIYLDYQGKVEVNQQLATTEEDLATTMQRLNEIQAELNQKITDLEKLGGDITELEKAKAEVDAELKTTRSRTSKNIKELKDRVGGYEQLLKLKDEELDKLKSLNKELYSENRNLKTTQNQLSDSINRLAKNTDVLANKVAIASQLKAENVSVVSVNNRGKERTSPFRSKQLETLKVDFNIAENKVAPVEGKKIMIKVTDENGQVIFDVAKGSGTFMLDGKEEFYTVAQEILFDNTRQKLSFIYEKGSEYASGMYTADIYTDGYKMGQISFTVK